MPGPFDKPATPQPDLLVTRLEKGHRARNILQAGAGDDLARRRLAIYKVAEDELRGGVLTNDRAFMHIACANALRAYEDELNADIKVAQRAADQLHTEADESGDGAS